MSTIAPSIKPIPAYIFSEGTPLKISLAQYVEVDGPYTLTLIPAMPSGFTFDPVENSLVYDGAGVVGAMNFFELLVTIPDAPVYLPAPTPVPTPAPTPDPVPAPTLPPLRDAIITIGTQGDNARLLSNLLNIKWQWFDTHGVLTSSGKGAKLAPDGDIQITVKTRLVSGKIGDLSYTNNTGTAASKASHVAGFMPRIVP